MRTMIIILLVLCLAAACVAGPAAAGAGAAGRAMVLGVYADDEAAPCLSLPIHAGSRLTVTFFHSYDRADFNEHYLLRGPHDIRLTNMTFRSLLNGQGFERGRYVSHADGSAELADINQDLREIDFRLGSPDLANHRLIVDGRVIRLLDHMPAGTWVHLRVSPVAAAPDPRRRLAQAPQSAPPPKEKP
ncbi:MAG: DUF1850 domain-containing protein [Pseudomonadota bacterium]